MNKYEVLGIVGEGENDVGHTFWSLTLLEVVLQLSVGRRYGLSQSLSELIALLRVATQ